MKECKNVGIGSGVLQHRLLPTGSKRVLWMTVICMALMVFGILRTQTFAYADEPELIEGYWDTTSSGDVMNKDEVTHWTLMPIPGDPDGGYLLAFTGLTAAQKEDMTGLLIAEKSTPPYIAAAKDNGTDNGEGEGKTPLLIKSIVFGDGQMDQNELGSGIKVIPNTAFAATTDTRKQVFEKLETVFIYDDSGVTEIGATAFGDLDSLKKVYFPNTLKKIGQGAFLRCSSLGSGEGNGELAIPDSVEEIVLGNTNAGAFYGTAYTSIKIGENSELKWLRHAIFSNMSNLTTVTLSGKKLKYIDSNVFAGDKKLSSVTLPANLVVIGGRAFYQCEALAKIDLPQGLRYIGFPYDQTNDAMGAFQESGLKSITIPSSVRFIGNQSFAKCKALETVEIKAGDEQLTIGMPGIKSFASPDDTVDKNTLSADGNTLYNEGEAIDISFYKNLKWVTIDMENKNLSMAIQVTDTDPFMNGTVIDTTPAKECFRDCTALKSITIPKNVIYVSPSFLGMAPMEGVPVDVYCYKDSMAVEAVNDYKAQYDRQINLCYLDQQDEQGGNNKTNPDGEGGSKTKTDPKDGNTSQTEKDTKGGSGTQNSGSDQTEKKDDAAQVPEEGQPIETKDEADYVVDSVTKDASGKDVVTVAYAGIKQKPGKKGVMTVPDSVELANGQKAAVTRIVKGAFKGKSGVKTVNVGKNVETVEEGAFEKCKDLQKLLVKSSKPVTFKKGAVKNCTKLTTLEISKLAKMEANAVSGCKKLKTLKIGMIANNYSFGKSALKNTPKKIKVYYPKKLKGKKLKALKKAMQKAGLSKKADWKKG